MSYNQKNSVDTDLLLDDDEIHRLHKTTRRWNIFVRTDMSENQSQIFYRNLIRLTMVLKVPRSAFHFSIVQNGVKAQALFNQLTDRGFENVTLGIESTQGVVAEPSPEYAEPGILFKEFTVAGLQYHISEESPVWNIIAEGTPVELVAEPCNRHDPNAVAIFLSGATDSQNTLLGYVPRSDNHEIAALLSAGWKNILIAKVSSYKPQQSYHLRLTIGVFILPNKNLQE